MIMTVRYFAGARVAAGVGDERFTVSSEATVHDVLRMVEERHGADMTRVLPACSLLLDGVAVRDTGVPVRDGVELDVLPPFAGG
ncbi:MAG: MoaD/ThiS family protein [Kutzneria sp.]|nr:MoaD/ThiS family protein [Kutzneria sp.]